MTIAFTPADFTSITVYRQQQNSANGAAASPPPPCNSAADLTPREVELLTKLKADEATANKPSLLGRMGHRFYAATFEPYVQAAQEKVNNWVESYKQEAFACLHPDPAFPRETIAADLEKKAPALPRLLENTSAFAETCTYDFLKNYEEQASFLPSWISDFLPKIPDVDKKDLSKLLPAIANAADISLKDYINDALLLASQNILKRINEVDRNNTLVRDLTLQALPLVNKHIKSFNKAQSCVDTGDPEQKLDPKQRDRVILKAFGDDLHPALRGKGPEEESKNRNKHLRIYSQKILLIAFPNGPKDLPIPANLPIPPDFPSLDFPILQNFLIPQAFKNKANSMRESVVSKMNEVYSKEIIYNLLLETILPKLLDYTISLLATKPMLEKIYNNTLLYMTKPVPSAAHGTSASATAAKATKDSAVDSPPVIPQGKPIPILGELVENTARLLLPNIIGHLTAAASTAALLGIDVQEKINNDGGKILDEMLLRQKVSELLPYSLEKALDNNWDADGVMRNDTRSQAEKDNSHNNLVERVARIIQDNVYSPFRSYSKKFDHFASNYNGFGKYTLQSLKALKTCLGYLFGFIGEILVLIISVLIPPLLELIPLLKFIFQSYRDKKARERAEFFVNQLTHPAMENLIWHTFDLVLDTLLPQPEGKEKKKDGTNARAVNKDGTV